MTEPTTFLRLDATPPQKSPPPADAVDVFYDPESASLKVQKPDGTTEEIGGGGASTWDGLIGNAASVPFDTTSSGPTALGELAWDSTNETLSLMLKSGTVLQVGEETLFHVVNNTGVTITDGTPVMYAGTDGNSGKLKIKPWDGMDATKFMGLATQDIPDGGTTGYVTYFGAVRGIRTNGGNYGETWADGDIVYTKVGSTGLTKTAPTTGNYCIVGAVISSHGSNGTLFVRQEFQKIVNSTDIQDSSAAGRTVLTSSDSYTQRNAIKAGIPSGPLSVACVGTSITNQGTNLVTTANPRINDASNGHAGWLEHLSNHRVKLVRRNGVMESAVDKTFGYGGYKLPGLTNGSGGVYPLDNAIASSPDVLVLEGGINDVIGDSVDSTTLIARITAFWTKARSTGLPVIALNCTPIGGQNGIAAASLVAGQTYEIYTPGNTTWTSVGAADNNTGTVFTATGAGSGTGAAMRKSGVTEIAWKNTINTTNAALPAIATSLGVTLIDTHSVAVKDGNGFTTVETLWDGAHPTPAYAHRLAKLINTQLATYYSNRPPEVVVPNDSSGLWISTNPSPSQGTTPTGYSLAWATASWAAVTDADSTTWQRCTLTQTQAAYTEDQIYIRTTTGFSAGDRVRFCARIRPSTGATAYVDVRDIDFTGVFSGGGTHYAVAITGGTNMGTGKYDPITGLFVSPILTVPTGTTTIDARLGFLNGAASACGFEFRQFGIFKVIENP